MKKYMIIISVVLIFFIGLIMIFYPNIRNKNELNALSREIKMVNKYLYTDNNNIDKIREYIKKKVTTHDLIDLEKEVDSYLNDIINSYENVKLISNEDDFKNMLSISKNDLTDKLTYIDDVLYRIETTKTDLKNIDVEKYITKKDNSIFELLQKKIDLNQVIYNLDNLEIQIKNNKKIIDFLNDNNNYWNTDDVLVFNKRKIYNEFENIIKEIGLEFEYKLIDDNEGPIINASNIVITEGDYLNINDYVSCDDVVDDIVECNISGDFNNNKPGTYPISIKTVDYSNNKTEKKINVIVKEKEKYNLPYVIEVIRNQSTTIVYGQDNNGEYTKIVGVFPCSPGAGENTPVGTFYTKRGFEWGGLFGNVYGQYSTVITGHILFHSVPYYSMNKDALIWEYYNNLGTKVSMGCIRLTVRDAKWIYDNCPSGTMVKIYDGELPNGISKPSAQKIDGSDERRGWDPTDPDPANPWNQ